MCRRIVRSIVALPPLLVLALLTAYPASGQSSTRSSPVKVWGFTGPWDAMSTRSVRAHGTALDAVITGWIAFDSATARPIQPVLYPDTIRAARGTLRRMAIVTSWHGDRFHPRTIQTLSGDPTRLGQAAGVIARHAAAMRYRGLVLDFESLTEHDVDALIRVVRAISDSAHRAGVRPIVVAIPATDTLAYPARALLEVADLIMPMLYDQHWSGSTPGAIADPAWVRETLGRFWHYFRRYWPILITVAVLVVIGTYLQVSIPNLIGQGVDCYLAPVTASGFNCPLRQSVRIPSHFPSTSPEMAVMPSRKSSWISGSCSPSIETVPLV